VDLTRAIPPAPYDLLPPVPAFAVESDDVAEGSPMHERHSAAEDVSPNLRWSGFPAETRSFVVSCFDPDAPSPAGYWHWTALDLPVTCTSLPTGAGEAGGAQLPARAFQTRNDAGSVGYAGAAPPEGDRAHRYVFAVHALDVETLGLGHDAIPTVVALETVFHTLARAVLTTTFQR